MLSVVRNKIIGTQFHPEKSGYAGLEIIKFKTFYMKLKTLYGLPRKVIFCKKTLISNQRPVSAIEFLHKKTKKKL